MKKLLFFTIFILITLSTSAQITRQDELFKAVPLINNKVSFLKEVQVKGSMSDNYEKLREWARANYGKDPFVSSVRYDARKNEIVAKSRVELVLPENKMGIREKMIMRFRVNGFMLNDKCVLEITDLSFLYDNVKETKLPRVIRAEEFITDEKIDEADALQELRINTRKSTLYFLNTLGKDFEEQFGY